VGQRNVLYGWEESKRDVRAIVGNVTRTVHARIADIMDAQVCYCFEMEGKDYAKARDVHRTSTKHKNERKKMKRKDKENSFDNCSRAFQQGQCAFSYE
jgi:hypothetical protein